MTQQRRPFFYVIEHTKSGIRYAGAKWGKDADPDTFMKPGGYQTSSGTIEKIIQEQGLCAFQTIQITEHPEPRKLETQFLNENNCKQSPVWFNLHHNYSEIVYDTPEFKKLMIQKYGVGYASQIPEVKEKTNRFKKLGLSSYAIARN
jgi:hypothetical protein